MNRNLTAIVYWHRWRRTLAIMAAMAISAILISEAGMRFSAYYQTQVVDKQFTERLLNQPSLHF
jgi:hypothetical protein